MDKPHTITIYNKLKVDDTEQYIKRVLNNVYYYGTDSVNISGKGVVESGNINIIIDGENLEDYVNYKSFSDSSKYTIKPNDRIVLGVGPDITSTNELNDSIRQITVFSIDENLVGSSLDNLLITGR